MENLKLDSFLEYKFLSNLDFNSDGSNLAFSISEADLEKNSYKHFIYNLSTKNKEIKKLTHSGKEKNSLWLNNNTILFTADRDKDIEEKKKLGETWTLFYALDIKNGGEAYEYMRLPISVTEIKIIDENEYTNVESFNIKENKVIFVGRTYKDKQGLTARLWTYDVKNNKLETIIPDNLYDISYANFIEDKIICALSDMKEYGINENHKIYLIDSNKNINLLYENDTWLACTVGSDCRLGGGKSFKVVGNKLYFLSTIADSVHLSSLDTNGKVEVLSSENGSIDFFDIANNEIYYVGMRNYTLQEIYKLENNSSIKLSSFNEEINKKYMISKPEVFDFITNGDTTKGFVIYPIDYDKNKTYPAILDIHGGPKTVYGDIYYHEMQVWANMDYFVIFTNPHGSDGYGNKFADIRGKYGTIDYEDLMNFTDYVLEKYPIDKSRVGVTGGSYGGYMTNWIIGHTDRFKCAASQRSISNWISKFGTTDIGYYFNADQNQATPWINHDKLWWHSPLKYADKAKTPTLFIHSEEDYRCWLAEGLQMFTALKYHGVEARLCMFRGENHELSRSGKPKHRIRRLTEITNWFEKYLKQ